MAIGKSANVLEDARIGALIARISNEYVTADNIHKINEFPPLYKCDVSDSDAMGNTRWFKDVVHAVVTKSEIKQWIESEIKVKSFDFIMDNPQNRAQYLSYNNLEIIKNHSGIDFYIYQIQLP